MVLLKSNYHIINMLHHYSTSVLSALSFSSFVGYYGIASVCGRFSVFFQALIIFFNDMREIRMVFFSLAAKCLFTNTL